MMDTEWRAGDPSGLLPVPEDRLPLWGGVLAMNAYPSSCALLGWRGSRPVAQWVLPLQEMRGTTHVRRFSRVLPYASPWLADAHPQRRRETMSRLLDAIQARFASIDLPMAPRFHDVTACRELGVAVEWRHTHEIRLDGHWRRHYTATTRNHIAAAERRVEITITDDGGTFAFDRGLVDQTDAQVFERRRFVETASRLGQVMCLTAMADGCPAGQAMVVAHHRVAYLFHSWFDRDGPRGVPSLLIDHAAATAREKYDCTVLDLEGSVLPGVDYFMSGFGGDLAPYPHLRWAAADRSSPVRST